MDKQAIINELIRGMQMVLDDWTAYMPDVRESIQVRIESMKRNPDSLKNAVGCADYTVTLIERQPMRYW